MRCDKCDESAVWSQPARCKEHFVKDFERRVQETIREYDLIPKGSSVCVAASGGKDSMTILHLLHKLGCEVEALAIDEGIEDYRAHSLKDLKKFCEQEGITLKIVPFKELVGQDLDDIMRDKGTHACTICGTLRRDLLNKHSQDYDLIATGHNADDEAQAIMMNLLRAQTRMLTRPGPTSGKPIKGFTQRIKPLYFLTEKEIMTYAIINNLQTDFTECPYAPAGYRSSVRESLNEYAARHPGTKANILRAYLKIKNKIPHEERPQTCERCGSPSTRGVCAACKLITFHKKNSDVRKETTTTNNA